jgi:hypothetical protein
MPDHPGGGAAGLLIADELTGHAFEVHDLAAEPDRVLRVTDTRAAFCLLTLTAAGKVTWEYFPFTGQGTDPAVLTAMIGGVLGAAPVPARAWPGPTLLGSAGRMLRDAGLHVTLGQPGRNDDFCELYGHLIITRPGHPERGYAHLTDEGMIIWECRLGSPDGLTAPDIAAALTTVLSRAQYPGHPAPPAAQPKASPSPGPHSRRASPAAATTPPERRK